jgi:hypothetical protein
MNAADKTAPRAMTHVMAHQPPNNSLEPNPPHLFRTSSAQVTVVSLQSKNPLEARGGFFRSRLVSSVGLEPTTRRLEGGCSIQLSYENMF